MAEENKEQEEQQQGGGKKKLIILLAVLLLLLGGGGGAAYKFLVLDKQSDKQENKAEKIQEEIRNVENIGIMYEVGTFVVNLADKDADRYLKVTVILEIENEQVKQEVEKRLPQIKDSITTLLFTKTSRELKTAEGVEKLKDVYFTDFVIQTA